MGPAHVARLDVPRACRPGPGRDVARRHGRRASPARSRWRRSASRSASIPPAALVAVVVGATVGSLLESVLGATLEAPGILNNDMLNFLNTADRAPRPRSSSLRWRRDEHERRGLLWLEFSRPFTLVAPALGFASGAVTAVGAAPREPWSAGSAALSADRPDHGRRAQRGINALNQIYDLEIDRINKPKRPLPSGRLTIARGLDRSRCVTYAVALVLAWLVAPGGRHECFWIVLVATAITVLYSVPPFRTKRLGIWANVTIAIPRGVLLKVAGWSAVKTIMASSRGSSARSSGCSCSARRPPRTSPTWKATRAAAAGRCRSSTACAGRPG